MKLYEIVNPSDKYTIEAPSLAVAGAATLLLGNGKFGLTGITDEKEEMPIFLFGGHETWLIEQNMEPFGEWVDTHWEEVAAALDGVLIGSGSERKAFARAMEHVKDPKEREAAWAAYHDEKRSSMNDIGGAAKQLAKQMRKAGPKSKRAS